MKTMIPLSERLYPNSPIEVLQEGNEWHLFVEGEWHSKETTEAGVEKQVDAIISLYADDWLHECTRVNPGWAGWKKITRFSLYERNDEQESGPRRAFRQGSY